jgi:hypothetical protein
MAGVLTVFLKTDQYVSFSNLTNHPPNNFHYGIKDNYFVTINLRFVQLLNLYYFAHQ